MLRRAASIGSSGSLRNTSSNNSRIKNGPICPKADRPSPHSKQEYSVMRRVARFIRVEELAIDEAKDRAVREMEQRDHDRRPNTELQTQETRAGQRRNGEHHEECSCDSEQNAPQPGWTGEPVMHDAECAAP